MNFVEAHQEDAAIAASLALAFYFGRAGKFEVVLDVAEAFDADDIPGLGFDFHIAVDDFPLGIAALGRLPAVQIGPVEEHHRVGGPVIFAAGSDDARGGSPVVVHAIERVG